MSMFLASPVTDEDRLTLVTVPGPTVPLPAFMLQNIIDITRIVMKCLISDFFIIFKANL